MGARAQYLWCKLKAGELFITDVGNDFMNVDGGQQIYSTEMDVRGGFMFHESRSPVKKQQQLFASYVGEKCTQSLNIQKRRFADLKCYQCGTPPSSLISTHGQHLFPSSLFIYTSFPAVSISRPCDSPTSSPFPDSSLSSPAQCRCCHRSS